MHREFYNVTLTLFTRTVGNLHAHTDVWDISCIVWSVWALQGTACIIKKRVMKKKTLCRCLIQIWCKCKCYSVGRCESNSSQFTCCGPFSVMKIGFLADTILLATKTAGGVKAMQIGNSHVEVSCIRKYLFIHMTIIPIMSGNTARLCSQCPFCRERDNWYIKLCCVVNESWQSSPWITLNHVWQQVTKDRAMNH